MTHADALSFALPGLFLTLRRTDARRWLLRRAPGGLAVQAGRWRVVVVRR